MTRSELWEMFACQAEWRTEKAEQYPEDVRNRKAAALLEILAHTVDEVPQQLLDAYDAVFLRWDTHEIVKLNDEALRAVGFRSEPESAEAWIRGFLSEVLMDRQRMGETYRPYILN